MDNCKNIYDVIIIGGGLAGLTAAWKLQQYGRHVLVLEKSRGVGGRMATRQVGNATFDHGAQFITVRESNFLNWQLAQQGKQAAGSLIRLCLYGDTSLFENPVLQHIGNLRSNISITDS